MWVSDIVVHTPSQLVAVMHHIVVCHAPENNKEAMWVLQRGWLSYWELTLADSTMTWCTDEGVKVDGFIFLLSVEEDAFSLSPTPLTYLPCSSSVSCLLFGASFCISSKF
ncbi:hypothetical protein ATANTOWER_016241 [Ataeniobius toweri]|uniref:Uncharacterized protein n=1 Tax=Ataeniobius toweri TaxID=208326 RepID=A0ABU7AJC1_9TELE|nr:hypothetical protein [Ataeniobius toweri]